MAKGNLQNRYRRDPRRTILLIIVGVLVLSVAVYALYMGGRKLEEAQYEEPRGDLSERLVTGPTIEYQGKTYAYKSNLLTVLFMGIDREDAPNIEVAAGANNGGQADFLTLAVINGANKTVTRLPIDRDTITEVTTLGILGNVSGTRLGQISLSHGFGDGREQSSQLTVEAVERLLHGIDVNFYVAMGMDSIAALNDAVGGVTVPIEDDFSAVDPSMQLGASLRLVGDQAEYYVRRRMDVGDRGCRFVGMLAMYASNRPWMIAI